MLHLAAKKFVLHFLNNQRYNLAMRHALKLHPDSISIAATHVEVEIMRPRPGGLALRYFVTGRMSELCMPPVVSPARADELWRHTCFEAFVRASPNDAYYEFNFSPSMQWAAYRFNAYRHEMTVVSNMKALRIRTQPIAGAYELQVSLALDDLENLPGDVLWNIGLSAVLEEKSGGKSYWALTHPPGEPDFHHSDCFALQIPPASRT